MKIKVVTKKKELEGQVARLLVSVSFLTERVTELEKKLGVPCPACGHKDG